MAKMNRVVVPAAQGMPGFSMLVPEDFRRLPTPEGTGASNPEELKPLGVFMAGYGVALCSVASRGLYEDRPIMDYVMELANDLRAQGSTVQKLMPEQRWGTTVVECWAEQPSDAGEMVVRALFFEDGGHLINVTAMAAKEIWGSVEALLGEMVKSFALLEVKGPTRRMVAGGPRPAKARFEATEEAGPAKQPAEASGPSATSASAATTAPAVTDAVEGLPDLGVFALDDAKALDPDEEVNARFRNGGVGFVPKVLHRDVRRKCAVVGVGALEAMMPVPMGWHVIDDGKRVLVFDTQKRAGGVQVNVNLFRLEGNGPSEVFTGIIADLSASSPEIEHRVFEAEGFNAMQVRNVVVDGEPVVQMYLLKRHPAKEELGLKVRVTADSEEVLLKACDMATKIVGLARFVS